MISTNISDNIYKGRLGNQIFRFAFLYGLHKAKGFDFCVPNNTDLINCFDIKAKILKTKNKTQTEKHFHFDKNYPVEYKDDIDYEGFYQSEKYFKHCKDDLKNILNFKKQWKVPLKHESKNLVSIHVRRGDYVGNSYHPVVGLDYINKAKSIFSNKKFLVFSDDIDWCKENKVGDLYSETDNYYIDLYHMTLCSASIIANSSFSWWGAYLGVEKEKVVCPEKWFYDKEIITDDIYCEDWIII